MLFTELAREKSSIFWERSFEHPLFKDYEWRISS